MLLSSVTVGKCLVRFDQQQSHWQQLVLTSRYTHTCTCMPSVHFVKFMIMLTYKLPGTYSVICHFYCLIKKIMISVCFGGFFMCAFLLSTAFNVPLKKCFQPWSISCKAFWIWTFIYFNTAREGQHSPFITNTMLVSTNCLAAVECLNSVVRVGSQVKIMFECYLVVSRHLEDVIMYLTLTPLWNQCPPPPSPLPPPSRTISVETVRIFCTYWYFIV